MPVLGVPDRPRHGPWPVGQWLFGSLRVPGRNQGIAETEFTVAQAAVTLRVAALVFPVASLFQNWSGFWSHDLVVISLVLMIGQGAFLVVLVRVKQTLRRQPLVLADILVSGLVLVLCVQAGPRSVRADGLSGMLPYLVAAACPVAAAYVFSPRGLAGLAALEALWAFAVASGVRLPSPLGDFIGFVFWYALFAVVAIRFWQLAARADRLNGELADERRSHAHTIKNVRRDLAALSLNANSCDAEVLRQADETLQFAEEDLGADIAWHGRELLDCIRRAEEFARAKGVKLTYPESRNADVIVLGEPPAEMIALADDVLRALILNLAHSQADMAFLHMLAETSHLNLQFSDQGSGFDANRAQWSEETRRLLERLAWVGATVNIDSAPGSGTRWTIDWSAAGPG